MRALWQDLRFGLRQWRRAPGFAAVAVLTLALGIAANVAIFSIVNSIVLAQPPIARPQQVAIISGTNQHGWTQAPITGTDFAALRGSNVFAAIAATGGSETADWVRRGAAQRILVRRVDAEFFPLLGVRPALGRWFTAQEAEPGGARVVILSHRFWMAHFAASRAVLGQTMQLGAHRYTIIGVMPASYGAGGMSFPAQAWTPLALAPAQLASGPNAWRGLYVYGRLRPGKTLAAARAAVAAVGARRAKHDASAKGWRLVALSLRQSRRQFANSDSAMWFFMGTVAFVLLIACANIAGLLLARSETRRQEMALRAALGAGRGRVARQMLAESLLLGAAGGALGLLGGAWGIQLMRLGMNWNEFVRNIPLPIDGAVLAFTAAATLVSVLVFGLLPAWQMAGADPQSVLKAASAGAISADRGRLRRILIGAEILVAVVLLAGTAFIVQQTVDIFARPYGFPAQNTETVSVTLPPPAVTLPAGRAAYFAGIAARVGRLPGVTAAGWVQIPPLVHYDSHAVRHAGKKATRAQIYTVSPGYLPALGAPLLSGRNFRRADTAHAPPVVLVNATMVRRYFGGKNPVGQFLTVHEGPGWTRRQIVGVVGDVEDYVGQMHHHLQVYLPLAQAPVRGMTLLVRSRPGAMPPAAALDRAIWAGTAGRTVKIGEVTGFATLAEQGGSRFMAELVTVFGPLALALAAVGLYGVIAYLAARRTREFALRMALGARRREIARLVARETARTAFWGLALGLAVAALMPRLLAALFGPLYPLPVAPVLVGIAVVIAAVAAVASLAPALRATHADPIAALRYE